MPENDSGDGESWEDYENGEDELGADEFLAALEEDALIDGIGAGGDVPETVDSERGMAEFLKEFRDRHMQDPITTPPWEGHAEKPLPPRQSNTGGRMSAQEDAERLRNIASSQEFPTSLLRAADTAFDPIVAQVLDVIGEQSRHRETVQGAASTARDLIDNAIAATMAFEAAIHDAADGHARG